MFSQRLIASCLLVLYGVPAAIGPYWHQHGSTGDHLQVCAADKSPCAHSHLACNHKQSLVSPRLSIGSTQSRVACDDCLVCQFYAHYSMHKIASGAISYQPNGQLSSVIAYVLELDRFGIQQARAPPQPA